MNNSKNNLGFTLVETLLYVGIFGIIIVAIVTFSKSIVASRMQSQKLLEVNDQGANALRVITFALRNAEQVNSPTPGNASTSSSLAMASGSKNPTIFSLDETSGVLNIKEGLGSATALTNNQVTVSNLIFTNYSRSGTQNAVQVSFTITSKADTGYSVNFVGSGGPRK